MAWPGDPSDRHGVSNADYVVWSLDGTWRELWLKFHQASCPAFLRSGGGKKLAFLVGGGNCGKWAVFISHTHTLMTCVCWFVCGGGFGWMLNLTELVVIPSIFDWDLVRLMDNCSSILDSSGTNQGCGLDELRTPWSGWPGSSCVNCIRSEFMSDGRLDKLSKMIYGSYFIQEIWWVFACGWDSPQRDGEPEIVPKLALLMKNNVIINNWSSKELLYNLKIEIKLQRKFFQQK